MRGKRGVGCGNEVRFVCKVVILSIGFSVKSERVERGVFLFGGKCRVCDECIF